MLPNTVGARQSRQMSAAALAVLTVIVTACGGDGPAAAPAGAPTTVQPAPPTAVAPTTAPVTTTAPTTPVPMAPTTANPLPITSAPPTVPTGWDAALRATANAHAADTVGAVLGLRHPDGATTTVSIGAVTTDPGSPALDALTPLGIGSVTKTFVAVVVLQLVEDGALGLDDDIGRWFPDLPDADLITVRHLLEHSSGLGEYIDSAEVRDGGGRAWTPEELIRIAETAGRTARPGDAHHYANTNYVVLGRIIEQVTGHPWFDEVRDRILEPLGMHDTGVLGDSRTAGSALSPGYTAGPDGWVPHTGTEDPSLGGAAGAMYSTVGDLLTFAAALSDRSLLSTPEIGDALGRFMPGDDLSAFDVEHSYGLGIERYVSDRVTVIGHLGVGSGHSAFVGYDDASGTAVAVVMNAAVPGPQAVMAIDALGAAATLA